MPAPDTAVITERRESFGLTLRNELAAADMSARDLAAVPNVHHAIVLKMLRGECGIELARVLDYGPVMRRAVRAWLDAAEAADRPRMCIAKLATARALRKEAEEALDAILECIELGGKPDLDLLTRIERELTESRDVHDAALNEVRELIRGEQEQQREKRELAKCSTQAARIAEAKRVG